MSAAIFGKQAFRLAARGTWADYKSRVEGFGGTGVITVFTLFAIASLHGLSDMWMEAQTYEIIIGANVGWVALLFLWHLWLAPYELALEAIRKAARPPLESFQRTPAQPAAKPVNWMIWKQMEQYTLKQFAAILAKDDPIAMTASHEQRAYLELLLADIKSGKLPRVKVMLVHAYEGYEYERTIDWETPVKKADAMAWADAHEGFDVSLIR